MRQEEAVSAGGVVWRTNPERDPEVVICGRSGPGLWCLPKGTPESGETIEETALREVREETGLDVQLSHPLGTIDYHFVSKGVCIRKRVHHWLMRATGGSLDAHDHEFDDVRWVPISRALEMLTYENERKVVRRCAKAIGRQP